MNQVRRTPVRSVMLHSALKPH